MTDNKDKKTLSFDNIIDQKLIKISIYLYNIQEKETMEATYNFEDGSSKEGFSYNYNSLSGTIDFSDEDYSIPIKDFIESFISNEWSQFIADSIDNFDGVGKSIEYDFDDFEDCEEENSVDCEWDANQDPKEIILHYEKGELKFNYEDTDCYINNNKKYNKEEILSIIKNS